MSGKKIIDGLMRADLLVFEDLAVAADTAELMLRKEFPAEAQSLHAKVKAAKAILDVALNRKAAGVSPQWK